MPHAFASARTLLAAGALLAISAAPSAAQGRLNPVISLLEAKKPVFGLYAPANRRARPGAPALPADSVKSADQLAAEAVNMMRSDYIFDGSMEGNFDAGYPVVRRVRKAMRPKAGKMHAGHAGAIHASAVREDARDRARIRHSRRRAHRQAARSRRQRHRVRRCRKRRRSEDQGIAAMRFKSQGWHPPRRRREMRPRAGA